MKTSHRPDTPAIADLQRQFAIALVAVNVAFPLAVLVSGLPEPWAAFQGEESAMNWFSSVQVAVLGTLAFAVYAASTIARRRGADTADRSWPWALVGVGFLFLSLDEQFQSHERIRDEILEPAGFLSGIPGLNAADVVLPLYALAGLLVTALLFRDLRRQHRTGLVLFGGGLALICFLVGQDSLSVQILERGSTAKARTIIEEAGEAWAQMLFALALVRIALEKVDRALREAQREPITGGDGEAAAAAERSRVDAFV